MRYKISTVLLVIGMTFLTSCTGENSEKSYVENSDNIVTGLPDPTVKIDLPEESSNYGHLDLMWNQKKTINP